MTRPPAPSAPADTPAAAPAQGIDLRELIRCATLAPSSHNAQPWRFRPGPGRLDVFSDPGRWLPIADADRRELHLSVGAALESLLIAAEHHGSRHDVEYFPDESAPEWVARVVLEPETRPRRPSLFDALERRRTIRAPHSGRAVDDGLLADLAAVAWDPGIWAWSSAEPEVLRAVARLVARGDRIEYADPAFRRELGAWVGRGLLGLPRPLAGLARLAVTRLDPGPRMARHDAALVEGSGALLAIVSKADDPITHVRAGQALQRVWLLATQLGLALQPMSQPLEIPELRRELARWVGAPDRHPQHLFRVGYAEPERARAPRRPLEEVLLD